MPNSGLQGPFPLTKEGIANVVLTTSPGAYALGETEDKTFMISRIGRSDTDIANRLSDYIGRYKEFKFKYYATPKAAFVKECELFHMFNPPDNVNHPDRPDGTDWECPICDIFG